MFTIEQIKTAHAKVKSGADFPAYISDLQKLGVSLYETHVSDGHTDYFGDKGFKTSSQAVYDEIPIAGESNPAQFKADLVAHQQGQTDYPTFCRDSARSGILKWIVRMDDLTCTYFDRKGNEVLVEAIPQ